MNQMSRTFFLLAVFSLTQSLWAQEIPKDLGNQVRGIFIHRCAECHGQDLRKPKGAFGFVEDLAKVKKEYSNDSELDKSDIWYYLTEADGDERMPPKKAKNGPLTTSELATIRWWVMAGAPAALTPLTPLNAQEAGSQDDLVETKEQADSSFLNLVAAFHPVLVHFPIALIMVAALLEILRAKLGEQWRSPLRLILGLMVLSALGAGFSGFQAQNAEGYKDETVFYHQWFAIVGTILATLAFLSLRQKCDLTKTRAVWTMRVLLFTAALLLAIAGHEGGLLVHGADHFG